MARFAPRYGSYRGAIWFISFTVQKNNVIRPDFVGGIFVYTKFGKPIENTYLCPKTDDMEALSIRDFRRTLAAAFNRASREDNVLIRRRNEVYALIKVGEGDVLTPQMQARIDDVHHAYDNGECVVCATKSDLTDLFESL